MEDEDPGASRTATPRPHDVVESSPASQRDDTAESTDPPFESALLAAQVFCNRVEQRWARCEVARALFGEEAADPPSVGRFVLEHRLGAGGMGVVFTARDPDLDREVAVKLVGVDTRGGEVLAEAQALARLSHPNVVAVHDVGTIDDLVYIVMEFVRGPTLREYAAAPGRTLTQILAAYTAAGDGLAAAHAAGLVHRDFKPDNAVLGRDDRVRVIDFGLAREPHRRPTEGELSWLATRPGIGTPRYMAPEQRRGAVLTPAADQFALGVSLREALFHRDSDGPGALQIPRWINATLVRATQPRPEDRYESLAAMLRELRRDPSARWRRRAVWGTAVAALGAAYAIGMTSADDPPAPDPCAAGAEAIAAAWPADARRAALDRIAGLGGAYARTSAGQLEATTTRFAEKWAQMHRRVCLAQKRGEQSTHIMDLHRTCLARSKGAYAMLGEVASGVEREALPSLALTVEGLPEPRRCAYVQALESVDPPPDGTKELVERLARWRVAVGVGRAEAVGDTLEVLVADARALGYGPVLAEVLLIQGLAIINRGDREAAVDVLDEALRIGLSSKADDIAVQAWAQAAFAKGTTTWDGGDALEGRALMEAIAERMPDSVAAVALRNNIGNVHLAREERAPARAAFQRAIELGERIDSPTIVANSKSNLALATDDSTERQRLLDDAVRMWSEAVGAEHPRAITARWMAALNEEEPVAAADALMAACEDFATLHASLPSRVGGTCYEAALAADQVGRAADAKTAAARAAELPPSGKADIAAAYLALWQGDAAGAEARVQAYLDTLEGEQPFWVELWMADAELVLAVAKRRLGRPDAEDVLARATARLERHARTPHLALARRKLAYARRLSAEHTAPP